MGNTTLHRNNKGDHKGTMQEEKKEATPSTEEQLVVKKNPGGRPRKPVDEETVLKLAKKLWPVEEIANWFNVSAQTIARRYGSVIDAGYLEGKSILRDLQWKKAQEGSERILLHMSQHHLGQHQKITQEIKQELQVQSLDRPKEVYERLKTLFTEEAKWAKSVVQSPAEPLPPSLDSPSLGESTKQNSEPSVIVIND